MGSLKKDFKYKLVKNFLTKEEQILLRNYCIIRHKKNNSDFDLVQNSNGDSMFYTDPLMDSLLVNKTSLMEKETGLELFPTYSFWRMSSELADLKRHKDRPSCEVSVTVMIDSDKTKWPIFMEGEEINLEPGDAVIYLGCELEHWRDEFKGDWHAQTFLHYVDKNGPHADFKFDKRKGIGHEV